MNSYLSPRRLHVKRVFDPDRKMNNVTYSTSGSSSILHALVHNKLAASRSFFSRHTDDITTENDIHDVILRPNILLELSQGFQTPVYV